MVQRGRKKNKSQGGVNSVNEHRHVQEKPTQTRKNNINWQRQEDKHYASPAIIDRKYSGSTLHAKQQSASNNLREETRDWRSAKPKQTIDDQNALMPIDLNPFYKALSEMHERIIEAEQSLENSRLAQQTLREEMDSANQIAQEAEEELAVVAQKAAFLKQEAEQICNEGQELQNQLNAEEQHWQQILNEEQQLLADTEHKLRIAEEESQRVYHAKEVAARMNEQELWRLGSSKQGLWLQKRKVQGNALSMTRDKDGSWHMPKKASRPNAPYTHNVLKREQKIRPQQTAEHEMSREQQISEEPEFSSVLSGYQSHEISIDPEFVQTVALSNQEAPAYTISAAIIPPGPVLPPIIEAEQITVTPESALPNTASHVAGAPPTQIPAMRMEMPPSATHRRNMVDPIAQPTITPPSPQPLPTSIPTPESEPLAGLKALLNEQRLTPTTAVYAPTASSSMRCFVADIVRDVPIQAEPKPVENEKIQNINDEVLQFLRRQETPPLPPQQLDREAMFIQTENIAPPYTPPPVYTPPAEPKEIRSTPPKAPPYTPPPVYTPPAEPKEIRSMPPKAPPYTPPPVYTPPVEQKEIRSVPPKAPPYTPPPVYTPPAEPKEIRSVPPKAPPYTPPPVYTPPTEPEVKETFLSENTPPRNQPPQYAPEINVELLQSLRPQNTPGQIKPSTNDPLHLLAMQAALETTIAKAEVAELEDNNFYADSRKQLAAAAERLQSGQLETLGGNEDDMQELTRQAHILAQQRLTRQQEITPAKDSAALMQRVAEETSAKDQIFKEQQLAERAIAAAMAAAKKAAQSAMTVSGHRNRQATSQSASQSAEQLIAAALSKASESNN